jgi:antitoxin component of RelBE/YafQ-DinJ toxin-antitoxin module
MDNVVQVRLSDNLKKRLERIADRMEVPVSTLIRMVLASFSHQPEEIRLTPNGFTLAEENRLLRSIELTKQEVKSGKAKSFTNIDKALASLQRGV